MSLRRNSHRKNKVQVRRARSRRFVLEPLEPRMMMSMVPWPGLADSVQAASAAQHQTLANLPVAAPAAINDANTSVLTNQGALNAASLAVAGGSLPASSADNTISNPNFETNSVWIASANDPNGNHSEGYTTAWASAAHNRISSLDPPVRHLAGTWVGISQVVDLTGVSGLLFDCRDTGIDGANNVESLQFLVERYCCGAMGQ